MLACKSLFRTSLLSSIAAAPTAAAVRSRLPRSQRRSTWSPSHLRPRSDASTLPAVGLGFHGREKSLRKSCYSSSAEASEICLDEVSAEDAVEELLVQGDRVERLMKMERRSDAAGGERGARWFPYLDVFRSGTASLTSREVVDVLEPYILDSRKERMRKAVGSRSYSTCLVVEGLTDFGNVSAAFRSADALGIQSVHVISSKRSKRYRDNRHVSMGAEKWLDIELWKSPAECFKSLRSRGYRIATTHLGIDSVSVYGMDWSCPTAIVIGNEHRGISEEALGLSDLHCSIPMNGMVDSFNVSVAAGILMHHAVFDRISRLGYQGDLTSEESQILLAEFFLRHRERTVGIVEEYAKQKVGKTRFKL